MSAEATRIMEAIMDRFKKGIPAGQGVVVAFDDKDRLTVIGDMEKIDARVNGVFILDSHYAKARMISNRVYAAYRREESPNIVIDKFSGKEIFRELNWETKKHPVKQVLLWGKVSIESMMKEDFILSAVVEIS